MNNLTRVKKSNTDVRIVLERGFEFQNEKKESYALFILREGFVVTMKIPFGGSCVGLNQV